MNIGKKTTYWQFIKDYGITIPVIQRDYAQGREGKEVLRRRLLENIKSCLDTGKELVLDFVYGMKDEDGHINPLDGQQRLTTLWLLHWYLLLKTKEVKNAIYDIESILNILSKFTYETRLSSRNFCECLCKKDNLEKLISSKNIRKDIENQTWFMAEWKQDPTVKAMLNMLGGEVPENEKTACIEGVFNEKHDEYWNKLVEKNGRICPIKFYYLSLDGEIAQRPDDIYIKMNARGEHLTDFENFKADLIKHVRGNAKWKLLKKDSDNPELYLSQCIDSTWTDVFWSQLGKISLPQGAEDKNVPSVDKQIFAFLNRYFLNCIFAKTDLTYKKLNEKDTNKIENGNENIIKFYQYIYGDGGVADIDVKYTDFALYQNAELITLENFNPLISIFNILEDKDKASIVKNYAKPKWAEKSNQEFVFFPHMKGDEIEPITQPQRVVFFGICCYLENCSNEMEFEKESFLEWIRFVWNMARNSDVDTVDNMIKVIKKINELKNLTHSIKEDLRSKEKSQESSYFDRQWNEEIEKFKKRDNEEKWNLILRAEQLFHGNISFLLGDSLLCENTIKKAKELIYEVDENGNVDVKQETNEYNGLKKEKIAYKENWFLEVLPYFKTDLFTPNSNYKLTFHEKTGDVVKNINHDDEIINAVQAYLKDSDQKEKAEAEKWIYPLVNIVDNEGQTLFDYSESKLIGRKDKGIYLYKKTQWKKEQCILLWTREVDTQNVLDKRNKFILEKLLPKGYSLLTDRDEKIIKDFSDDNYGRPIILTDNQNTYYCGVNGYWGNDTKKVY